MIEHGTTRTSVGQHEIEVARPVDALQGVLPLVFEPKARSGDRILGRGTDQDLSTVRLRRNPRCQMNGDSLDAVIGSFQLTGVDAYSNRESGGGALLTDHAPGLNRNCRTIEESQKAVPRHRDLLAIEPIEHAADEPIVTLQGFRPDAVSQSDRDLGGSDEIGDEDGCHHPNRLTDGLLARRSDRSCSGFRSGLQDPLGCNGQQREVRRLDGFGPVMSVQPVQDGGT